MTDQKESKPIKKPDATDLKIAHLLIERPSITDQEIADQVGLARMAVNRRRNSEPVKTAVQDALALPSNELRRLMVKSLKRIEELLDSPDVKLRSMAAFNLVRAAIQAHVAQIPAIPAEGINLVLRIGHEDDEEDSGSVTTIVNR